MKATRVLKYLTTNEFAILKDKYETMIAVASEGAQISQEEIDRLSNNSLEIKRYDNVGVVRIDGAMIRRGDMFSQVSGLTSYDAIGKKFKELEKDSAIDTIVAHITSPGGEVAGVAALGDMIGAIEKKKVAYIDDLGASAAYWLASQFDEIYANETALIGSIGVITSYAKSDDEAITIVSSNAPYKNADPSTEEGYKRVQARLTSIEEIFISKVAQGRGVSTEKVLNDFGQGDVLIASKALEAGMIDKISSFEDVIKNLQGEDMNLKELVKDPAAFNEAFTEAGIPNPFDLEARLEIAENKLAAAREENEKALIVAFCGANRDYISFAEEKEILESGKSFADVQQMVIEKAEAESEAHETHTGKEGDEDAMQAALSEAVQKINARR